jgi:hypothetical protein
MNKVNELDAATRGAYDDATVLLLAARSTRSMNETFKNASDLDARRSRPAARQIMWCARDAAGDLFVAAFSTRPGAIEKVRARHFACLLGALEKASELAKEEYAAFPLLAGRGVFDVSVVRPLRALTDRWKA